MTTPKTQNGSVQPSDKLGKQLNYYVLAAIFISIVIFDIGNAVEPQIDNELDIFELLRMLGFAAAAIFAFFVSSRYWGSKVFGRAYLALGIGYAFYFMGDLLWYVFQVGYLITNPYPYWPDIGYFGFYPFAIYHLRTNLHYFKRKLERNQKLLLVILPVGVTVLYLYALLAPVSIDQEAMQTEVERLSNEAEHGYRGYRFIPLFSQYAMLDTSAERDQQYWNGVMMGTAYVAASTLTFTFALLGTQVLRHSFLGAPWGLILLGIGLNWVADMHYYYSSIYFFDRTNPVHGIWLAGTMVLCYGLYKHRSL